MPYPDGMPSSRSCMIELECRNCGHYFEVEGRYDLGQYYVYDDQDCKCPECNSYNVE